MLPSKGTLIRIRVPFSWRGGAPGLTASFDIVNQTLQSTGSWSYSFFEMRRRLRKSRPGQETAVKMEKQGPPDFKRKRLSRDSNEQDVNKAPRIEEGAPGSFEEVPSTNQGVVSSIRTSSGQEATPKEFAEAEDIDKLQGKVGGGGRFPPALSIDAIQESDDSTSFSEGEVCSMDSSVVDNNSTDTAKCVDDSAKITADKNSRHSYVSEEPMDTLSAGESDLENDNPDELVEAEGIEEAKPEDASESTREFNQDEGLNNMRQDLEVEILCEVGKKRVAHVNATATSAVASKPKLPRTASKSLRDTLLNRFEGQTKPPKGGQARGAFSTNTSPRTNTSFKPVGKVRTAHAPNSEGSALKTLAMPPSKFHSTAGAVSRPGPSKASLYPPVVAKGLKREAHQPSANVTAKLGPQVYRDAINKSSRIPYPVRQQIMNKMYDEYCRILKNPIQAFKTTVAKENELVGKCFSKGVYYSSGVSIVTCLRAKNKQDNQNDDRTIHNSNSAGTHQAILAGGSSKVGNFSTQKLKRDGILPTGNSLYKSLRKYLMTEKQLVDNGYPRPHPSGELDRAVAKVSEGRQSRILPTLRTCDRCKKSYVTTEDGDQVDNEKCHYHWGRKRKTFQRGRVFPEANYICCGNDDNLNGCATAPCHVSSHPVPVASQNGFVEALLAEGQEDMMGNDPWDIIGLDCEMVYTTHGLELARVTVVGVDRKVLYDEIIQPPHKVLDCNTRFSGITPAHLRKATTSLSLAQEMLLAHLRPNTIIIGHSLESDFIALRLKHECVIDTSVLYPPRTGYKRALKSLSIEILRKVIQEGDNGHDSVEDAQVAVELVLAKLKSELYVK